MQYNFKTIDDNQQWMVDTELLIWARASTLLAAPSIKAVESNIARFVPQEEGKLIPLGGGRFALAGRPPVGPDGKPQLAIVIIVTVLTSEEGGTAVTFIQTNMAVKDEQHQEIKKFKMLALPAIPPPTKPGSKPIAMPPIMADEQEVAIKAAVPEGVAKELEAEKVTNIEVGTGPNKA